MDSVRRYWKIFLSQKKKSKSLSWAENLNKLFTDMGGKFKFSAQDRDLEYFFEKEKSSCIFWRYPTFTKKKSPQFSMVNGVQISIKPRPLVYVPELNWEPSGGILHQLRLVMILYEYVGIMTFFQLIDVYADKNLEWWD